MSVVFRQSLGAFAASLLAATLLLAALPARAVLGGDDSSVVSDQARLHGARRAAAIASTTVVRTHEITLADGSTICEFVTPAGVVFAVAWSTRFKPDLEALFGAYAASYAEAASATLRSPGIRRHVELRRGDLVVRSTSHLGSYVGTAWLQSLVPQGVGVDALR